MGSIWKKRTICWFRGRKLLNMMCPSSEMTMYQIVQFLKKIKKKSNAIFFSPVQYKQKEQPRKMPIPCFLLYLRILEKKTVLCSGLDVCSCHIIWIPWGRGMKLLYCVLKFNVHGGYKKYLILKSFNLTENNCISLSP